MSRQARGPACPACKTLKEAKAKGLRTAEEWLREEQIQGGQRRRPLIPKREAKPVVVKGKELFSREQCEDVISASEAKKRDLRVPEGAVSVRNGRGRYEFYPMFRVSDCIPASQAVAIKTQEDYLTHADLRRRGWTDSLIERFLACPDATRVNPHYKSRPPMKLYCRFRVERSEQSEEFQKALARSAPRKHAASIAAKTKRAKTAEMIENMSFTVPRYDREKLIQLACDSYNAHNAHRDNDRAIPNSDPEFLERICVNYLRHEATRYDAALASIYGHVGKGDAHILLKEKVLDAIAEEYPWLEDECDRQLERHWAAEMYRRFRG